MVQPRMRVRSTCIGRNAPPAANTLTPRPSDTSDVIGHHAGGRDVTAGTCDVTVGGTWPAQVAR